MKTVKLVRRYYRVTYIGFTWTLPADAVGTARTVSMLRAARGWDLPIIVTPFTSDEIAPACAWCRARPRALLWAGTVRRQSPWCDAPQCQAARHQASRALSRSAGEAHKNRGGTPPCQRKGHQMIDVDVEDGYEVTYDLAQVVALAELAVAAAPDAAIEISRDGSRLRFTAGPTTMLPALGREGGRWARPQRKLTFGRCEPVAIARSQDGCSSLTLMRSCLAEGGKRLYLTRCAAAESGWILRCNAALDLRRPPYNVRERYLLRAIGIDGECYLLDLERGLPYRTKRGQSAVKGPYQRMRALADRLNSISQ